MHQNNRTIGGKHPDQTRRWLRLQSAKVSLGKMLNPELLRMHQTVNVWKHLECSRRVEKCYKRSSAFAIYKHKQDQNTLNEAQQSKRVSLRHMTKPLPFLFKSTWTPLLHRRQRRVCEGVVLRESIGQMLWSDDDTIHGSSCCFELITDTFWLKEKQMDRWMFGAFDLVKPSAVCNNDHYRSIVLLWLMSIFGVTAGVHTPIIHKDKKKTTPIHFFNFFSETGWGVGYTSANTQNRQFTFMPTTSLEKPVKPTWKEEHPGHQSRTFLLCLHTNAEQRVIIMAIRRREFL